MVNSASAGAGLDGEFRLVSIDAADFAAMLRESPETRSRVTRRLVDAGMTGWPGVRHISDRPVGGAKDVSAIIVLLALLHLDMKFQIASAEVGAYPDVMVVCGEREFYDNRRDVFTNPTLIVEVLSDWTEAYDRGDRFWHYRNLESLQGYLLL